MRSIYLLSFFVLGMSIVNCSVLCTSTSRVVYPWTIKTIGASGQTVSQFYMDVISKEISREGMVLNSGYLGSSLDSIDLNIPIDMAVQTFGPFLRYKISSEQQLPLLMR